MKNNYFLTIVACCLIFIGAGCQPISTSTSMNGKEQSSPSNILIDSTKDADLFSRKLKCKELGDKYSQELAGIGNFIVQEVIFHKGLNTCLFYAYSSDSNGAEKTIRDLLENRNVLYYYRNDGKENTQFFCSDPESICVSEKTFDLVKKGLFGDNKKLTAPAS